MSRNRHFLSDVVVVMISCAHYTYSTNFFRLSLFVAVVVIFVAVIVLFVNSLAHHDINFKISRMKKKGKILTLGIICIIFFLKILTTDTGNHNFGGYHSMLFAVRE